MTKRKTIQRLEAIIDALEQSKLVVSHNRVETELIINRVIDYQVEYKKIAGHYYTPTPRNGGKGGGAYNLPPGR